MNPARDWLSFAIPRAFVMTTLAALGACSAVLGLRDIAPAASPSDGGGAELDGAGDAAPAHAWKSGFALRSVIDDDYGAESVDNASVWLKNIGTWRTGTTRNNCRIFNAAAYPDPGQSQTSLDYLFGTLSGSVWGPPASLDPSTLGVQALWSTPLTRGNALGLKDTNAGNADTSFRIWFTKLVAYGQEDAIIRLGWGMAGDFFAWSIAAPINLDATTGYGSVAGAATAYQTAYRRVVDIARAVPGQAFTFEWNAYFLDAAYGTVVVPATAVAAAYPGGPDASGKDYVDVIGVNAYDLSYVAGTPTIVQGTGAMAQGSRDITNWIGPAGRRFASSDVGSSIQVYTAGPSGSAATDYPLFAEIVSVDGAVSPPTATLDVPALRSVTGVMVNVFDPWPSAAYTNPVDGLNASLAAFAAFGKAKGKPLGVSEWAPTMRMDGHGGNDDAPFVQAMYDFFADPDHAVAYDILYVGLDGTDVGPTAKSALYPLIQQAAGGKNGPFHDGADALPRAAAKYHALFGPL